MQTNIARDVDTNAVNRLFCKGTINEIPANPAQFLFRNISLKFVKTNKDGKIFLRNKSEEGLKEIVTHQNKGKATKIMRTNRIVEVAIKLRGLFLII